MRFLLLSGKKSMRDTEELDIIMNAIKKLDDETREHSIRVAEECMKAAELLGFYEDERRMLFKAGLLHDIGKFFIPETILLKPSSLTVMEQKIVRKHPDYGYEIVKNMGYDDEIALAVKQHHENYDGTGYGEGLEGNEINLFAQIIHIIDVYDALKHRRSYKEEMEHVECMKILTNDSGTFFNPDLLEKMNCMLNVRTVYV